MQARFSSKDMVISVECRSHPNEATHSSSASALSAPSNIIARGYTMVTMSHCPDEYSALVFKQRSYTYMLCAEWTAFRLKETVFPVDYGALPNVVMQIVRTVADLTTRPDSRNHTLTSNMKDCSASIIHHVQTFKKHNIYLVKYKQPPEKFSAVHQPTTFGYLSPVSHLRQARCGNISNSRSDDIIAATTQQGIMKHQILTPANSLQSITSPGLLIGDRMGGSRVPAITQVPQLYLTLKDWVHASCVADGIRGRNSNSSSSSSRGPGHDVSGTHSLDATIHHQFHHIRPPDNDTLLIYIRHMKAFRQPKDVFIVLWAYVKLITSVFVNIKVRTLSNTYVNYRDTVQPSIANTSKMKHQLHHYQQHIYNVSNSRCNPDQSEEAVTISAAVGLPQTLQITTGDISSYYESAYMFHRALITLSLASPGGQMCRNANAAEKRIATTTNFTWPFGSVMIQKQYINQLLSGLVHTSVILQIPFLSLFIALQ